MVCSVLGFAQSLSSIDKDGLAPRLVQFYVDSGVIEPEIYRGTKRGDHHKFSRRNVFAFALIKQLRDYGINLSTIRGIVNQEKGLGLLDIEKGDIKELKRYCIKIYGNPKADNDDATVRVKLTIFGGEDSLRRPLVEAKELEESGSILIIDLKSLHKRVFPE